MAVYRVYTEKRARVIDGEAKALLRELRDILLHQDLNGHRVL